MQVDTNALLGMLVNEADMYAWIGRAVANWNFLEHAVVTRLAMMISPDSRVGEAIVYGEQWATIRRIFERVYRATHVDAGAIERLEKFLRLADAAATQRQLVVHRVHQYVINDDQTVSLQTITDARASKNQSARLDIATADVEYLKAATAASMDAFHAFLQI